MTEPSSEDRQPLRRAGARQAARPGGRARVPSRAPAPSGRRSGWWRPWVAGVLITIGALLAPLSIVATWAHDEVSDTDRYVATVAPLGSDPAVQNAIIDRITTEIFARLDVKAVTNEAVDALAAQGLPPRVADSLRALSTPLANGVRSFVTERVTRIIKSPEFEDAWVAANREAHTQLVAVLTGEGTDAVNVTGNTVSVNLAVRHRHGQGAAGQRRLRPGRPDPRGQRPVHDLRVGGPREGAERVQPPREASRASCR